MTTNVTPTLNWLSKRDKSLAFLMNKGKNNLPLFPKEAFISLVKDCLKLDFFDFTLERKGLFSSTEALTDMNKDPLIQPLVMGPMDKGGFFCVTSEENIRESMAVIFQDPNLAAFFYDKDKIIGFHYYFMTEICRAFQASNWFSSLSLKLSDEVSFSLPQIDEKYWGIDVDCYLSSVNFKVRFLVTESTFGSWETFFAGLNTPFDINRVNKNLPLSCSLEIGRCSLQMDDWSQVVPGSFILLDSCLFDCETEEGGGFLSFGGKAFFGGKFLKNNGGQFKITNYPTMGLNMEDSDLSHADQPRDKGEEAFSSGVRESLAKVPLDVVIEVAKYNTTVENFMKLSPGSVLDLGVYPTQGVNLVINGSKVGRGELVALGDVLGVRVLELWN